MRILYINLISPFSEQLKYKENYIIRGLSEKKHSILIISTLEEYRENRIQINKPGIYRLKENVKLLRIPYDTIINKFISMKVRKVRSFLEICQKFKPDILIMNGIQFYDVQKLKKIKKMYPDIKIYGDVSAAAYNSATNWFSYYFLHKGLYCYWLKKVYSSFDKIFYVSQETKEFLISMYHVPLNLLEEQRLCCEVMTEKERKEQGISFRKKQELSEKEIIFTHTGKMDSAKGTISLLKQFIKTKDSRFRLMIAGAFSDDIKEEAMGLLKRDKRIMFLGFLKHEDLLELLCATDLYIQPGSCSQTLQTAIGCLCPVAVRKMKAYEQLLEGNNYWIESPKELGEIFAQISLNMQILKEKQAIMGKIAEKLDYRKMTERYCMEYQK